MKMDYIDYSWDQKTFDVHILRSHDRCAASVIKEDEKSALVNMNLTLPIHNKEFNCVFPMVKEDGEWRVSRRLGDSRRARPRELKGTHDPDRALLQDRLPCGLDALAKEQHSAIDRCQQREHDQDRQDDLPH